ncbi:hypothetical protein Leryth_023994 [Lithospermum erythrorhizon]|nr:hypothetical protein Leryth_023994 [Lithospermum erythrorhizon]
MIIQPLFFLVFLEIVVIISLLFRTPLRRPLILVLDAVKQGRGPVISTTVGVTLLVFFISILFNIMNLQKRAKDSVSVNPTEQLILAYHLLQASFLGFSLVLAMMIDRLHYYIKELRILRKWLGAEKRSRNLEQIKEQEYKI